MTKRVPLRSFAACIAGLLPSARPALAAGTLAGSASGRQPLNPTAIGLFVLFVVASLGITLWAGRRGTKTTSDFYAAGGRIGGFANGLAIAGDYTSAATFLGVTALVYASGYDGMIYAIGFLVGFPMILFLIAEPLRNLGRFTFGDVLAYRLGEAPVRTMSAINTLVIVVIYLVAQMVGAGKLIELLFGLPYWAAVGMVGLLMMFYVAFGGMLATTWVQIVKALLLMSGSVLMCFLIMRHFAFSFDALFAEAVALHPKGLAIMEPGGLVKDPVSAISLGLALIFGTAGLPHILMRFFTVRDASQARTSVLVATGFITIFYSLLFVLGFGSIALVLRDPAFRDASGQLVGGTNMVALHLAEALGGSWLLGFVSAVAFATILAVVSGLTIAGASAASHDLYARVLRRGGVRETDEVRVSKWAAIALSLTAMALGLAFENQNIAFLVGLAFAIAASANFPVLLLSVKWPGLTTRGAVTGSASGLLSALALVGLSPAIWTAMGFGPAPFPYDNPAVISMPLAFGLTWLVSRLDRSPAAKSVRDAFALQNIRAQTGIAAE